MLKDHKEGDAIDIASMHKRLDEAIHLSKRRIYDVFIVFEALGLVGPGLPGKPDSSDRAQKLKYTWRGFDRIAERLGELTLVMILPL